jgi:hypothetical protein
MNYASNIFLTNNADVATVRKWVASAPPLQIFMSMQALVHRWRKCMASDGDYVER